MIAACITVKLEILQIIHGSLYKTVLRHIQVGIDLHGGSDAGVTDGFGEGGQIEIRIVFMTDVLVGLIGAP